MRLKFSQKCVYKQNDPAKTRIYEEGHEYDVSDDHGTRWLRRGVAVKVEAVKAKPVVVEAPKVEPVKADPKSK